MSLPKSKRNRVNLVPNTAGKQREEEILQIMILMELKYCLEGED